MNLFWTENGQRAGTFNGHNGVVWTTDISCVCMGGAEDCQRIGGVHETRIRARMRLFSRRAASVAPGGHRRGRTLGRARGPSQALEPSLRELE